MTSSPADPARDLPAGAEIVRRPPLAGRSIVLVGMMGAGKSSIGRRLGQRLGLPFADSDSEIEKAAQLSVEDIFELYGEAHFRDGERRVIRRLLEGPPQVLATGGGAYMDPETRALVSDRGVSVWLDADLDLLHRRVSRRGNRPLLKTGEPRAVLERLLALRNPVYALADLHILSDHGPIETTVEEILSALSRWTGRAAGAEPSDC
ncbi:MAG: shikimate kinase [Alphaproteobacteria bacterium]|nr:shikimate kinase [Alphaproteobacteria bacterium]